MSDDQHTRSSGSRKLLNLLLILAPLIIVALLLAIARQDDEAEDAGGPLLCYVGGTMYPVMQELTSMYEEQTGVVVKLDRADSGSNYLKIKEGGKTEEGAKADLNVAHAPYLNPLLEQGLAPQGWVVAGLMPVIAVQPGSEKIKNFTDLATPEVQIGLTSATHSTLGHILPRYFARAGIADRMEAKEEAGEVVRKRSGNDICNDVVLGRLEACVVWNAVAIPRADKGKVDVIPIAEEYKPEKTDAITSPTLGSMSTRIVRVFINTIATSDQPAAARKFAQWVDSPEGRAVFEEYGFSPSPIPSGQPLGQPDLKALYQGQSIEAHVGAGLQPAVDACADAFEEKSGATITRNYGGSGTLLATLKTDLRGDIYMPGDIAWVEKLGDDVAQMRDVAYFVPVILVQEGNPKNIQSLQDLKGVSLALGEKDACQIGKLTVQLIEKNDLDADAIHEATVFTGTEVPMLANQVKIGKVDAAIVWGATAAAVATDTDVVDIPPEQNITSKVTAGLLQSSENEDLAIAFMNFMAGAEGRDIFKEHGYTVEPPSQED